MSVWYDYPTPYGTYRVTIDVSRYANGRTALVLMDEQGETVAIATVNLPNEDLGIGEMFIKTWSENATMLQFLVANGIVEDTGRTVPTGFVRASIVRALWWECA